MRPTRYNKERQTMQVAEGKDWYDAYEATCPICGDHYWRPKAYEKSDGRRKYIMITCGKQRCRSLHRLLSKNR